MKRIFKLLVTGKEMDAAFWSALTVLDLLLLPFERSAAWPLLVHLPLALLNLYSWDFQRRAWNAVVADILAPGASYVICSPYLVEKTGGGYWSSVGTWTTREHATVYSEKARLGIDVLVLTGGFAADAAWLEVAP